MTDILVFLSSLVSATFLPQNTNILFNERCIHHNMFKLFGFSYRLAPEHTYPVPLDDCVAATKHLLIHAHDYKVDPDRVVIAGRYRCLACRSLWLSRLPKLPNQCYSKGPGSFRKLGSTEEIQPPDTLIWLNTAICVVVYD